MELPEQGKRSYRCTYHPKDKFGQVILSDTGALPSIQLQATSANQAEMLAWATLGCPIASVERLDEVAIAGLDAHELTGQEAEDTLVSDFGALSLEPIEQDRLTRQLRRAGLAMSGSLVDRVEVV